MGVGAAAYTAANDIDSVQSKARIQIWLFEQNDLGFEGRIIGFDEYMNLVLDDAEEYSAKKKTRKALGDLPYWDRPEFIQLLSQDPNIIVLMLGTNDAKTCCSQRITSIEGHATV
ncbi:hypothetical protein CYMTET_28337 [Cymbomonas tetramitiformis]|uniref:Small nuclear ribonucleoprotein E n=1 Tax=Cymbomonas tetramitiformis TaxID=36881 RepID=A0AAE0KW06_9CHLO|nr:hypothetical protein CYMTET_28337 [Cymbomonas tetramitiformis]